MLHQVSNVDSHLNPTQLRRILLSLILPGMLMPLMASMSRVALPNLRDQFILQADATAWIDVAFSLPFMILMPVYGRLGDGLGARRLILIGIILFILGTAAVLTASTISWLLVGRAIQGLGLAGMMPLGMALVATVFPPNARGQALGTWGSVGPITGLIGPLIAGFLVAAWGWRGVFALPLIFGFIAFIAVYQLIPHHSTSNPRSFLRRFDWLGVLLLGSALTTLVVFLSSRAVTNIKPLHDWRLALATAILLIIFIGWEKKYHTPFVDLGILINKRFIQVSFCASIRMVVMGGIGFLAPLYLVDIKGVKPAELGGLLMISSGAMALVVRLAGTLADRRYGRWFTFTGMLLQVVVMLEFYRMPASASTAWVGLALGVQGLGAGLMLATLHRAIMTDIAQEQMGAAAGLYSMFRFLGAVIGTALAGVLLQQYLDAGLSALAAYQQTCLILAAFPACGALAALTLRD